MDNIINKLTDKKGHTLVTVLLIMTVAVMLGTILISVTLTSYENSALYYKQKQAYFTARSALDAFIAAANGKAGTTGLDAAFAAMTAGASGGYESALQTFQVDGTESSYQYKFRKVSSKRMKVTAYGAYKGETSKVSCYFTIKPNSICPTECLFYCLGGGFAPTNPSSTEYAEFDGRVVIRGAFAPNFTFTQTGDMVVGGTFHATKPVDITGKLVATGSFNLYAGSTVGSIYTDCTPAIAGSTVTTGIVQTDLTGLDKLGVDAHTMTNMHRVWNASVVDNATGGSILMANGDMYAPNDVWSFKEGSVGGVGVAPIQVQSAGGVHRLNGITTDGEVTRTTGGRNWTMHGGVLTDGEYTYDFNAQTITFPVDTGMAVISYSSSPVGGDFYVSMNGGAPVAIDDDTVITSTGQVYSETEGLTERTSWNTPGDFTAGNYTVHNPNLNGATVFDTTDGDIRVFYDSPSGKLKLSAPVTIKGNHQVYIYLDDGTELEIDSGTHVGEHADEMLGVNKDVTQLNIIGNECTVKMGEDATYKGIIYLKGPDTSFEEEGDPISQMGGDIKYRIRGSVTTDHLKFTSGNYYQYIPPIEKIEFDATLPDTYFIPPRSSVGSFEFERYGR